MQVHVFKLSVFCAISVSLLLGYLKLFFKKAANIIRISKTPKVFQLKSRTRQEYLLLLF